MFTLLISGDGSTQPCYAGGAAEPGALGHKWFTGPMVVGCAGMEAS